MHSDPQNTIRNPYRYIPLFIAMVVIFADTGIGGPRKMHVSEPRSLRPIKILRSRSDHVLLTKFHQWLFGRLARRPKIMLHTYIKPFGRLARRPKSLVKFGIERSPKIPT